MLQAAIGHLNRMYGDPQFLKEHRETLLPLYGAAADPMQGAADLARSTERMLGDDSPLGEAIAGADPQRVSKALQQLPATILEAQRAVVHRNLQRAEPYGMTFAWAPGYDAELTVWESPPTSASPGWITVLMRSRYPADSHPVTGVAADPDAR